MKITQDINEDKFILKESQSFTLKGSRTFTIDVSENQRKKIKICFDLNNPKCDKDLYNIVLKENINGLNIEVIELHCDSDNTSYAWTLDLDSSLKNEKLVISCVHHDEYSYSYSKDKSRYTESLIFMNITVSHFIKE